MDALNLLAELQGDNIPTDVSSADESLQLFCQEDTNCDCRGCDND